MSLPGTGGQTDSAGSEIGIKKTVRHDWLIVIIFMSDLSRNSAWTHEIGVLFLASHIQTLVPTAVTVSICVEQMFGYETH